MAPLCFRRALTIVFGGVVCSLSGWAQQSPRTTPVAEEEPVLELTPFEVNASADDGYRVTNALSGTRFNTNLLDLPKAVDVVSSEFMKDICATDLASAMQYIAGVNQDGPPGVDDITGGRFTVRVSPQRSALRLRDEMLKRPHVEKQIRRAFKPRLIVLLRLSDSSRNVQKLMPTDPVTLRGSAYPPEVARYSSSVRFLTVTLKFQRLLMILVE